MKRTIIAAAICLTPLPILSTNVSIEKNVIFPVNLTRQIVQIEKTDTFKYVKYSKYYGIMEQQSSRWGVPLQILFEVIKNESSFNPNAINRNRNGTFDEGLMQLNSRNYTEFKWRFNKDKDYDPYDPETNIRIGCQYLNWLYNNKKIGKKKWYNVLVFWNGSKESSKLFAKRVLANIK